MTLEEQKYRQLEVEHIQLKQLCIELNKKLNLATMRLSCLMGLAEEIQKTAHETMSSIND